MTEHNVTRKRRGRRGNKEGTIYQRSDGRWEARLITLSGKRLSFYGRTRAEVAAKLQVAQAKQGTDTSVAPDKQTLAQFLSSWLDLSVRPRLAPKTVDEYATIDRLHLVPELGPVSLTALNQRQVAAMLRRKTEAGLSPRRVHHIRAVLRTALNQAVKWEYVSRNVAALTDPIKQQPRQVEIIQDADVQAILDAARGHRFEALFVLSMALGLRQGEVLGLHWNDVDFVAGTLRVRWSVQRVAGQLLLKPPKTEKSRRLLHMPDVVAKHLLRHRARQDAERARIGEYWQDRGLVFSTQRGTPIDPRNLIRDWYRLQAAAGVDRQRFHDTRHTAISTLAAMGVPLHVIKEVVGHSMLATTADIYTHVAPQAMQEAAAAIDRKYGDPGPRSGSTVVKLSSKARGVGAKGIQRRAKSASTQGKCGGALRGSNP